MDVVTTVLEVIAGWVTGFATNIVDVLNAFVPLFYVASPDAGVTPAYLTVFGALALMGLSIGIVKLGFNFVRRLFNK